MEPKVKHRGEVSKAGKLQFSDLALFQDVVNRLRGKKFNLVIWEDEGEISLDSYAYYFGAVLTTAHKTNQYSHFDKPEDIHHKVFAPMFIMHERAIQTANGVKIRKEVRSLSDLSQKEMNELIERVIAYLAEDGIVVLDSEQYLLEKRYKTLNKNK